MKDDSSVSTRGFRLGEGAIGNSLVSLRAFDLGSMPSTVTKQTLSLSSVSVAFARAVSSPVTLLQP